MFNNIVSTLNILSCKKYKIKRLYIRHPHPAMGYLKLSTKEKKKLIANILIQNQKYEDIIDHWAKIYKFKYVFKSSMLMVCDQN